MLFLCDFKIPPNYKEELNHETNKQLSKTELNFSSERELLEQVEKLATENVHLGINTHTFSENEILKIESIIQFVANKNLDKTYTFSKTPIIEITSEIKNQILKENHNANSSQHFGENRTIERIKEKYYWPNIGKDVHEFISNREICQREKLTRIRHREPAVIPDTPTEPNNKISMDIFGPLPVTTKGKQFILSIQDVLTKYLVLIPLKDQRAGSIINGLLLTYN